MNNSLLAIDVGNTTTALGLFDPQSELLDTYTLATDRWRTADEIHVFWAPFIEKAEEVPDFILSSVVPTVTRELMRSIEKYYGKTVYQVIPQELDAMPIKLYHPEELGPDRLVNAIAGREKYGVPLIIVDLGTATTYEVISEAGEYLGGAICPGVHISAQALFERTALLPKVQLARPVSVMGKSTLECLQSGLYYGLIAQVEGLVERLQEHLPQRAKVVATGGYAELLGEDCDCVHFVDCHLTLKGLEILYQFAREGKIQLRCTKSSTV